MDAQASVYLGVQEVGFAPSQPWYQDGIILREARHRGVSQAAYVMLLNGHLGDVVEVLEEALQRFCQDFVVGVWLSLAPPQNTTLLGVGRKKAGQEKLVSTRRRQNGAGRPGINMRFPRVVVVCWLPCAPATIYSWRGCSHPRCTYIYASKISVLTFTWGYVGCYAWMCAGSWTGYMGTWVQHSCLQSWSSALHWTERETYENNFPGIWLPEHRLPISVAADLVLSSPLLHVWPASAWITEQQPRIKIKKQTVDDIRQAVLRQWTTCRIIW